NEGARDRRELAIGISVDIRLEQRRTLRVLDRLPERELDLAIHGPITLVRCRNARFLRHKVDTRRKRRVLPWYLPSLRRSHHVVADIDEDHGEIVTGSRQVLE